MTLWLVKGFSSWRYPIPGEAMRIRAEVDPGTFLGVGATLLVGFLLGQYMSVWSSDLKVEREVIVAQAKKVGAALDVLSEALLAGAAPVQATLTASAGPDLVNIVRKLLGEVSLLVDITEACESEPPPAIPMVLELTGRLWTVTTSVPAPKLTVDHRRAADVLQRRIRQQLALVELQAAKRSRTID